ncbi:proline-rich protein 2-like [Lontra canadensis]|uniref:proline-rich protein 2-like n=1 Tax=Lontra canadensis TaxID=76717 RepID=UPI0013F35C1E|nr:proline-rich protein 2-like [Lontra canadensis]
MVEWYPGERLLQYEAQQVVLLDMCCVPDTTTALRGLSTQKRALAVPPGCPPGSIPHPRAPEVDSQAESPASAQVQPPVSPVAKAGWDSAFAFLLHICNFHPIRPPSSLLTPALTPRQPRRAKPKHPERNSELSLGVSGPETGNPGSWRCPAGGGDPSHHHILLPRLSSNRGAARGADCDRPRRRPSLPGALLSGPPSRCASLSWGRSQLSPIRSQTEAPPPSGKRGRSRGQASPRAALLGPPSPRPRARCPRHRRSASSGRPARPQLPAPGKQLPSLGGSFTSPSPKVRGSPTPSGPQACRGGGDLRREHGAERGRAPRRGAAARRERAPAPCASPLPEPGDKRAGPHPSTPLYLARPATLRGPSVQTPSGRASRSHRCQPRRAPGVPLRPFASACDVPPPPTPLPPVSKVSQLFCLRIFRKVSARSPGVGLQCQARQPRGCPAPPSRGPLRSARTGRRAASSRSPSPERGARPASPPSRLP